MGTRLFYDQSILIPLRGRLVIFIYKRNLLPDRLIVGHFDTFIPGRYVGEIAFGVPGFPYAVFEAAFKVAFFFQVFIGEKGDVVTVE